MQRVPDPCWTCRNRRIQCDQSGMPCGKCEKAGLECLAKRPFRWVKGVAIRGKMQGRSYENRDDRASAKSKCALMRALHRQNKMNYNASFPDFPPGMPFVLQDPNVIKLDPISKYYIDYYNERICQLFITYDSDKNPFRRLISLGLKDPVLLKALLALAARHHSNTGLGFGQPDDMFTSPAMITANRDALRYKHQVIKALSLSLQNPELSMQDTTVASIFLLIFLDLLECGADGWNFHLEGAKKLIEFTYLASESQALINQGPGQTVQEIRTFITKQIYCIETLGSTFLQPKFPSRLTTFDQQELRAPEVIEKSFLGCPEYFLAIIQCLSTQRDSIAGSKPLGSTAAQTYLKDTTALLESIRKFDCYAWAGNLQQSRNSSSQETTNLRALAESYKLGALLYGRRILDAITGEFTVQDEILAELLGMINSLKDDRAMFKCILWPIFVAGLESQWPEQRCFLIDCIEKFWAITNCKNGLNAAKTLDEYWQQEGSPGSSRSQWIFTIGRLGRDWLWV